MLLKKEVVLEEVDDEEKKARNNEECPRCRTTRMQRPSLKLFVSTCGHALCEECLNTVFHNTPAYPCAVCRTRQNRVDYTRKLFEDSNVHRSVMLRKEKLKDLNLALSDFQGNIRKYNDYLELKEDIIYNLEHNIDLHATQRTLTRFIERHKEIITANKARMEREYRQQLERQRVSRASPTLSLSLSLRLCLSACLLLNVAKLMQWGCACFVRVCACVCVRMCACV